MGRCTSFIVLKGWGGTKRCDTVRDMLWVCGDEGVGGLKVVNEGERVEEGEKGGWCIIISAVNALTCNMDLIA